jgi:hypothetical protein
MHSFAGSNQSNDAANNSRTHKLRRVELDLTRSLLIVPIVNGLSDCGSLKNIGFTNCS